jgi:methanogenic corrinoid protein MtbC1
MTASYLRAVLAKDSAEALRVVDGELEVAGFEVCFLAANIQTAKRVEALQSQPSSLLGLSASLRFHLPGLRAAVVSARSVAPLLPIVVGGGLLESEPGLADDLGVQAFGASADVLARTCRQLLGLDVQDPPLLAGPRARFDGEPESV